MRTRAIAEVPKADSIQTTHDSRANIGTPTSEERLAQKEMDPVARNATAAAGFSLHCQIGNVGIADLTLALNQQIEFARSGTEYSERMLLAQANLLDVLSANLISRCARDIGHNSQSLEMMRLALRAQNQCRMTMESIATIKNPSAVLFARQANFANGPQQVNNCPAESAAQADIDFSPNELLESSHGKRLDPGAKGAASGADPDMATLGTVNGANIHSGQATGIAQSVAGRSTPSAA